MAMCCFKNQTADMHLLLMTLAIHKKVVKKKAPQDEQIDRETVFQGGKKKKTKKQASEQIRQLSNNFQVQQVCNSKAPALQYLMLST